VADERSAYEGSRGEALIVPGSVGGRLRERREQRGLSLRALARAVGVSPSMVSQIENGKANPSVGTLYAIVSALGLSLDELFAAEGHNGGRAAVAGGRRSPGPVLRAPERSRLDLEGGVRWERLSPSADAHVDFLLVTYQAGAESCPPDALMRHSGREYGLVLSGRLGATVGFDSYELAVGDSIAYDSTTPHRFWTVGDEPCRVVWTVIGRTE
jgi:transcriptional regulator with XRE-family HTH domain